MKIFILFSLLVSSSLMAQEFLEVGDRTFQSQKINSSRWIFDMGADYFNYQAFLPSYDGQHQDIKDDNTYGLYGVSLNIGREFNLTGGLSSTIKLGTFFNKTIESSTGKASDDVDLDMASTKDDHQILGAQASLDVNYLIETDLINLQPFIGMGGGRGQSNFTKVYKFDGLSGASLPAENYNVTSEETFNFTKATVGLKLISKKGILSYIQASQINYVKDNRKLSGKIDGTKINSDESINEETSTIIGSIGFGILF